MEYGNCDIIFYFTLDFTVLMITFEAITILQTFLLKSVRVHFAYGIIAITLELPGRFGRFLDEDDRCNPPVFLIPYSRLLRLSIKS